MENNLRIIRKQKARQREKQRRAGYHDITCVYCGKTFFQKQGSFCSRECYLATVKIYLNLIEKRNLSTPVGVGRGETCKCCGKRQIIVYPNGLPALSEDLAPHFCNENCKMIWEQERQKRKSKKGS